MAHYYLFFAFAVIFFVFISFLRMLFFWKRVRRVEEVSDLSARDQKQYEKYRTEWPHDKLAVQKIFETRLMMAVFVGLSIISVIIYLLLSRYL